MRNILAFMMLLVLASVVYADYKELFEKEFVHKTWVGSRVVEEGVCIDCHTSDQIKEEYITIPQEWKMSIHYANKISCHDCHGGDPGSADKDKAHGDDISKVHGKDIKSLLTTVEYERISATCGRCHKRNVENYKKSKHYRSLAEKGRSHPTPTCITCHGSINTTIPTSDAMEA